MSDHPLKSHEIYLLLCRMDNRGLTQTEECRVLRDLYSLVMRREQQELAPSSRDSLAPNQEER